MDISIYMERLNGILADMTEILKEMNLTVAEGNCFKSSTNQYCGSIQLSLEVNADKWDDSLENIVDTPFTDKDFTKSRNHIRVKYGDGADLFSVDNGKVTGVDYFTHQFNDLSVI